MKTFRYALRVAALLVLFMLLVLLSISGMFRHTVGRPFHDRLRELRATEAVLLTMELEARLGDLDLRDPETERRVQDFVSENRRDLALLDADGVVVAASNAELRAPLAGSTEEVPCGARLCRMTAVSPRSSVASVPFLREGRQVGSVSIDQGVHHRDEASQFLIGLLAVGVIGLIGLALLSLYLTRPLRLMSRSMDRIASGDLSHRVTVKGRDEVARMGESFNTMADRVSAMIRGHQELLAAVSHELRSPITRMKLSVELLHDAADEHQKSRKHLGTLGEDIDELDSLVDELLTASRLDLGTATLRLDDVDLDGLISEAWFRVEAEAVTVGSTLTRDVEPEDLIVRTDRTLTVRLLGNLFENAVQHAPGARVIVRARASEGTARISVIDDGPGVAAEALEQLFDPFFRTDASRSRRTGGNGLGLMIVRRAVEAQGGTVRASTTGSEGGLTISFDLPTG